MKILKQITGSKAFYIVLACFLSVALWLYVVSFENVETDREFKGLEITFFGGDDILRDRNLLVTDKDRQNVTLTLRGKRSVVLALKPEDVQVSVDLTDIRKTGVYEKVYNVDLPEGIRPGDLFVVGGSPEFVTVNIDTLIHKPVEVRGDFDGSVADGYMREPIVYEPETIMVSGPEEIVSHIAYAYVVVDRENLSKTVVGSVDYTLRDFEDKEVDRRELSTDTDRVSYTIPIVMVKDIVLTVDLIEGGGAKSKDTVVEIEPKAVTLSGHAELLDGINKLTLGTIDLSEFAQSYSGTYSIPLPNGVKNISGETEAKITVSVKGLSTRRIIATDISFINVSEGYTASPVTQYKEVTIRGPEEIVDLVEAGNIRIVGDLADIGNAVGRYSVPTKILIVGYSEVGVIGSDYNVVVSLEPEKEEGDWPSPPPEESDESGGENAP